MIILMTIQCDITACLGDICVCVCGRGGGLCRVDVGCVDHTCSMCKGGGSSDGGGAGHFLVWYNSSERCGSVMVSTTA